MDVPLATGSRWSLPLGAWVLSFVAGCAATGVPYEHLASHATEVAPHRARVVIFRTGDTLQYAGRAVALRVDEREAGSIALAGFTMLDLEPGAHSFIVDMWDAPGACRIEVDLAAGRRHYLEVMPRPGSFLAGLPGSLAPVGGVSGLVASTTVIVGGMAAESSGKACGGAFSITPVAADQAEPKLSKLRANR